MKYYIIAGEPSGDLHGSNLVKELKKLDGSADIRGWGGDLMQKAGVTIVKHYNDLAFMGFIEVIKNLPTILNNLKFCKQDVASFGPDVLILIDYPGFNLRIAKWAKSNGLKVVYYISPQVWAWKESRVKLIKKVVDKMLVILPFEETFYQKHEYKVTYVGHPLMEVVGEALKNKENSVLKTIDSFGNHHTHIYTEGKSQKLIALLPGSREQEISIKLPLMLEAATQFPDYLFVVAQAPGQPTELYNTFIKAHKNAVIALEGQTYTLLKFATAALVTSGTATLETALFGVPQVVCYKGSPISYFIAKRLVKIKYISLVNLIMDKPVVTELIQNDLSVGNIVKELKEILNNDVKKQEIKKDYDNLRNILQAGGNASGKAAVEIISFLKSNA